MTVPFPVGDLKISSISTFSTKYIDTQIKRFLLFRTTSHSVNAFDSVVSGTTKFNCEISNNKVASETVHKVWRCKQFILVSQNNSDNTIFGETSQISSIFNCFNSLEKSVLRKKKKKQQQQLVTLFLVTLLRRYVPVTPLLGLLTTLVLP